MLNCRTVSAVTTRYVRVKDGVEEVARSQMGREISVLFHVPISLVTDFSRESLQGDFGQPSLPMLVVSFPEAKPIAGRSVAIAEVVILWKDDFRAPRLQDTCIRCGIDALVVSPSISSDDIVKSIIRKLKQREKEPFRKRTAFFSDNQLQLFRVFDTDMRILRGQMAMEVVLQQHVALSRIVSCGDCPELLTDKRRKDDVLNRSSVGFVFLKKSDIGESWVPMLCIEYDGGQHDDPERDARNCIKDELLRAAGIPLLRLRTRERFLDECFSEGRNAASDRTFRVECLRSLTNMALPWSLTERRIGRRLRYIMSSDETTNIHGRSNEEWPLRAFEELKRERDIDEFFFRDEQLADFRRQTGLEYASIETQVNEQGGVKAVFYWDHFKPQRWESPTIRFYLNSAILSADQVAVAKELVINSTLQYHLRQQ